MNLKYIPYSWDLNVKKHAISYSFYNFICYVAKFTLFLQNVVEKRIFIPHTYCRLAIM